VKGPTLQRKSFRLRRFWRERVIPLVGVPLGEALIALTPELGLAERHAILLAALEMFTKAAHDPAADDALDAAELAADGDVTYWATVGMAALIGIRGTVGGDTPPARDLLLQA
jgi:hypothetical protein